MPYAWNYSFSPAYTVHGSRTELNCWNNTRQNIFRPNSTSPICLKARKLTTKHVCIYVSKYTNRKMLFWLFTVYCGSIYFKTCQAHSREQFFNSMEYWMETCLSSHQKSHQIESTWFYNNNIPKSSENIITVHDKLQNSISVKQWSHNLHQSLSNFPKRVH